MLHQRLGMNAMLIALTVGAVVCYGAFLVYGMWIDGRRQKVREAGKHPVTEEDGKIVAEEDHRDG